MAKSKSKQNPQPPTSWQLKKLASVLIDTRKNAYREADAIGFELDDAGWEAMEKQEKLFRCDECNWWQGDAYRAYPGAEHCNECGADRFGDDLE